MNSIGLILDIFGAIIIFIFGLSNQISPTGSINLVLEQTDKVEIKKAKKYKLLSSIGISLLIIGFTLQLISNFIE